MPGGQSQNDSLKAHNGRGIVKSSSIIETNKTTYYITRRMNSEEGKR